MNLLYSIQQWLYTKWSNNRPPVFRLKAHPLYKLALNYLLLNVYNSIGHRVLKSMIIVKTI